MERRNFIKSLMMASAAATVATPSMLLANETAKEEAKKEAKKPELKGPNDMSLEDAIKAITDGKELKESDTIKLTVPEIAENGAVVPVKVEVKSPMSEKEHVKSIHVLNSKNSNSRCADIMLTPANDKAYFSTRVKLAETQEIIALVALSDGTFMKAGKSIKVTIGGCG
jgi:sulfur-oxidizing protein SoxY